MGGLIEQSAGRTRPPPSNMWGWKLAQTERLELDSKPAEEVEMYDWLRSSCCSRPSCKLVFSEVDAETAGTFARTHT